MAVTVNISITYARVNITDSITKVFRIHTETQINMSLAEATEELKKLKKSGSFEAYRAALKGQAGLKDLEHAAQAKRAIALNQGLTTLAPIIVELGGLLVEEYAKREAIKERAERREKLQGQLLDVATTIADEFWKNFEASTNDFSEWINHQERLLTDSLKAYGKEQKKLLSIIGELEGALISIPGIVEKNVSVG